LLTVKKKKKMIEEFAPAALIGFVLSGLVIFLGLSQGPRRKQLATGLSSTPFEIRDRASVTPRLPLGRHGHLASKVSHV